tara:strand:- start:135 stop:317 length:183 start_codon:yes stop_codon:yes gene_type:complete
MMVSEATLDDCPFRPPNSIVSEDLGVAVVHTDMLGSFVARNPKTDPGKTDRTMTKATNIE